MTARDDMTALKPCPFCGERPMWIYCAPPNQEDRRIACANDECFGPQTTAVNESATVQWNARVAPPTTVNQMPETTAVIFWYRNHRGEAGYRHVIPIKFWHGATEWHPERQILLRAFDTEKNAERDFAVADIKEFVGLSDIVLSKGAVPAFAVALLRDLLAFIDPDQSAKPGDTNRTLAFRIRRALDCDPILATGLSEAVRAWQFCNELRADEGSGVELLCDNPDFNGQPNNAVVCCGDWTGWDEQRFTGDTIVEALRNAHQAMIAAKAA